jgi:hypothetical protein
LDRAVNENLQEGGWVNYGIWAGYRCLRSVSLDTLQPESRLYARMSLLCYNSVQSRQSSDLIRAGYKIDMSCSNERISVFFNSFERVVVIGFRGTTHVSPLDLGQEVIHQFWGGVSDEDRVNTAAADFNIVLGAQTSDGNGRLAPRIQQSLRHVQSVIRKTEYSGYATHVTGHSLGGMIAMSIAARHSFIRSGHVFNAGSGLREGLRMLGLTTDEFDEASQKLQHHHILGDPCSAAFSRGCLTIYRPCVKHLMNPHTMSHFLPEEWL